MVMVVRFWDPFYHHTYRDGVGEAKITRALRSASDYVDVDPNAPDYRRKTSGLDRDAPADPSPAWVVRDGNYVSARWPGDAYKFAKTFAELLARGSPTEPPPGREYAPPG